MSEPRVETVLCPVCTFHYPDDTSPCPMCNGVGECEATIGVTDGTEECVRCFGSGKCCCGPDEECPTNHVCTGCDGSGRERAGLRVVHIVGPARMAE